MLIHPCEDVIEELRKLYELYSKIDARRIDEEEPINFDEFVSLYVEACVMRDIHDLNVELF
jgi:hypothetical protein